MRPEAEVWKYLAYALLICIQEFLGLSFIWDTHYSA